MSPVILEKGGERVVSAEKDRVRLTVYVESEHERRFRAEAESMYRSLSDHMNAILSERYGLKSESAVRTNGIPKSATGR